MRFLVSGEPGFSNQAKLPVSDFKISRMILNKVVLPLPFGPSNPNTAPLGTSKETFCRAWIWPYAFDKPLIDKTGCIEII